MKKLFYVMLAFMAAIPAYSAETINIVQDGKSSFTIVKPNQSNPPLDRATLELQKDIYLATGAKIEIKKDDEVDKKLTHIISLGFTQQASDAEVNADGLGDDGYRIVTRDNNIYIIGKTHLLPRSAGTPAGQLYKRTGSSIGTTNGIYSFLEKYLGVRWLMPGDTGRVVPKATQFAIPEGIAEEYTPQLRQRMLTQSQEWMEGPAEWQERQRTFFSSARIQSGHVWQTLVPADMYKEHPDWFAMRDGKRVKPTGHYGHKLETTNPELVRYVADQVIKKLKADKESEAQSLSPTDMHGWSESPESKKFYDPAPENSKYGPDFPSVTPLILKFYRDVATIVKKEYPQGRLAGYLYGDYLFPPEQGDMELPDNFIPVIAPNTDYGFKLYKKANRDTFEYVMDSWMKAFPSEWYYYDLPNVFLYGGRDTSYQVGNTGTLAPPGVKILDYIFPYLAKNHASGGLIYGANSWSSGALTNYSIAKMLWDPTLKASDLQKEWLNLAYGKEAGAAMGDFYQGLEGIFEDYSENVEGIDNWFEDRYLKRLYGDNFDRLKVLFEKAQQSSMTDEQRLRFDLIADNFTLLEWRLQNIGAITTKAVTDKDVDVILRKKDSAFTNIPLLPHRNKRVIPNLKVQVSQDAKEKPSKLPYLGGVKQTYVLYAPQDGTMRLSSSKVSHGSYFTSYLLRTSTNSDIIEKGLLYDGAQIEIPVKKGTAYYLIIPSNSKMTGYELTIDNAQIGKSNLKKGALNILGDASALQLLINDKKGIIERDGNVIITKEPSETNIYWDQD